MDLILEETASLRLRDTSGREREMRALWGERTGVLGFLRHFG